MIKDLTPFIIILALGLLAHAFMPSSADEPSYVGPGGCATTTFGEFCYRGAAR